MRNTHAKWVTDNLLMLYVVGLKRCNSTPAVIESSAVVSLEMMKIGTPAKRQLSNDDDQSWNINSSENCRQMKSSVVGNDSAEQTSTNDLYVPCTKTSCLGDRSLSPPCSHISCPIKISRFGNSSNYVSSHKMISRYSHKSICSNDISCSLPSFPLKPSFELHKIDSSKSTSNFELTN